jgi:hypothetical protein
MEHFCGTPPPPQPIFPSSFAAMGRWECERKIEDSLENISPVRGAMLQYMRHEFKEFVGERGRERDDYQQFRYEFVDFCCKFVHL